VASTDFNAPELIDRVGIGAPAVCMLESTPDEFVVADDGPDIPEEDRKKVFDHDYTGRRND